MYDVGLSDFAINTEKEILFPSGVFSVHWTFNNMYKTSLHVLNAVNYHLNAVIRNMWLEWENKHFLKKIETRLM